MPTTPMLVNPFGYETWRFGQTQMSIRPHHLPGYQREMGALEEVDAGWRVTVETRKGYVYACVFAEKPTRRDAVDAWIDDRRAFRRFDPVGLQFLD